MSERGVILHGAMFLGQMNAVLVCVAIGVTASRADVSNGVLQVGRRKIDVVKIGEL